MAKSTIFRLSTLLSLHADAGVYITKGMCKQTQQRVGRGVRKNETTPKRVCKQMQHVTSTCSRVGGTMFLQGQPAKNPTP